MYHITCLALGCDPLIQPNLMLYARILGPPEKGLEPKALSFSYPLWKTHRGLKIPVTHASSSEELLAQPLEVQVE